SRHFLCFRRTYEESLENVCSSAPATTPGKALYLLRADPNSRRVPRRVGIPTIDQVSIRPCNRRSCSQLVTWSVESFAAAGAVCYHM
ncbi:unnamed protein product, partial [Ectocarpus sp. 13 AM-2016]